MRLRLNPVCVIFLVAFLLICRQAVADQNHQDQSPKAAVFDVKSPSTESMVKATLLGKLNLMKFEGTSDITCEGNASCNRIDRLRCVVKSCESDGSKSPTKCFMDQISADPQKTDQLFCQAVAAPTSENRKAFLESLNEVAYDAANTVNNLALAQAIKGDSKTCENVIKEFVGPYTKGWKMEWLIATSGCRIVAKQRTRVEEENDYLEWHNMAIGLTTCDAIAGDELRAACLAGVEAP